MDYMQDPQAVWALAVGVVSILAPIVIAIIRRWYPAFELAPRHRKLAAAVLATGIAAYAATPGDWQQRLLGAVVAIIASQGVYNVGRGGRSWLETYRDAACDEPF